MRVPDRCLADLRERGYLVFEGFLAADELVAAQEALDLGLVSEVVAPEELMPAAMRLAEEMVIWTTSQFAFVTLSDTSSMPCSSPRPRTSPTSS